MYVCLSWSLGETVDFVATQTPDVLRPEYDLLQQAAAQPGAVLRPGAFDIVAAVVSVPQQHGLNKYLAANRGVGGDGLMSVARVLRARLAQLFGAAFEDAPADAGIKILTLPGVGTFLETLASVCAAEGEPLPYDFWTSREHILELPLSPSALRGLFRKRDDMLPGAGYSQLCDGWVQPGVNAMADHRILVSASRLLGLLLPTPYDEDERGIAANDH